MFGDSVSYHPPATPLIHIHFGTMPSVKLCVRDQNRCISGSIPSTNLDHVIASLAAEPESIEELSFALARFERFVPFHFSDRFEEGLSDEPDPGGLVILDLPARLVILNTPHANPDPSGEVPLETANTNGTKKSPAVPYHLSSTWQLHRDPRRWKSEARERREKVTLPSGRSFRRILYERVVSYLVRYCRAACGMEGSIPEYGDRDATSGDRFSLRNEAYHSWMLNARPDIGGNMPLEILLRNNDAIAVNLRGRRQQWIYQGKAPAGVSRESGTFHGGGFGPLESHLYRRMVHHISTVALDRLSGRKDLQKTDLDTDIQALHRCRENYLDEPIANNSDFSRREVIEGERRRVPPVLSDGSFVPEDNCSVCRDVERNEHPLFLRLQPEVDDLSGRQQRIEEMDPFEPEGDTWGPHHVQSPGAGERGMTAGMHQSPYRSRRNEETTEDSGASLWTYCDSRACKAADPETFLMNVAEHLAELSRELPDDQRGARTETGLDRAFGYIANGMMRKDGHLTAETVEQTVEQLARAGERHSIIEKRCLDLIEQIRTYRRDLAGNH